MALFAKKSIFPWIQLTSQEQLNEFLILEKPILIFKHSTRCSISSMVLSQFENDFLNEVIGETNLESKVNLLFLDLIKYRDLSNKIAVDFNVIHQSPQLIVIQNNIILHHASHEKISVQKIIPFIS
jgi:bacillithiol system protein YtxJ